MIDFVLLAANTADGFSNHFNDILKDKYIYCIKGGSGVGKSTFMREIIKLSTLNGIKYIQVPCSSDINSLDMVVLSDKNVAFVDATNPHCVEPSCYGAKEIIVNLGDYLDCDVLKKYDKELLSLVNDKAISYKNCYNALSHAKLAEENIDRIYTKWMRNNRIKETADRIYNQYLVADAGSKLDFNGYIEYLTETGVKSIFAKIVDSRDIINVKCNNKVASSQVLKIILAYLELRGINVEKYYSIYDTRNLVGLGVYNYLITTIDVENCDAIYDINDMYDNVGIKNDLNDILAERKIFDFGVFSACNYFAKSRAIHGVIEEYYIEAMNFDKWEVFKSNFIASQASWLQ